MAKKDKEKEKEKTQDLSKEKKEKAPKEKKAKGKKGKDAAQQAAPGTSAPMTPDQMTNAQLEQAIRDSNDPSSQLKKLRSPISVKNLFLFLLAFIVMTIAIVLVWCAIAVDKFNFVTVIKDMSWQYGITQFFQKMWETMSGWFK